MKIVNKKKNWGKKLVPPWSRTLVHAAVQQEEIRVWANI